MLVLLAAACGGAAESDPESDAAAPDTSSEAASAEEEMSEPATTASCDADTLPVTEPGTLTVATGEPVFEPWMVEDDPANGEGFESALVYALAEQLGFAAGDVTWVRAGFDESIAPGPKDYDFNIQQYSITPEREQVVDFANGYYPIEQAIIGAADGPAASASSLADLGELRLGAASGTTSLNYIEDFIQPAEDAAVYDDNASAKAAFDAGQVDAIVFDLPTAFYITAVEIPEASIIGVLPKVGEPEELGMLFEDGSTLVPCVNEALATLADAGTLAGLEDTWLTDSGNIPTLSE